MTVHLTKGEQESIRTINLKQKIHTIKTSLINTIKMKNTKHRKRKIKIATSSMQPFEQVSSHLGSLTA